MVLDTPFIMSLILTAIVTIIMILVFAEIAEAIGVVLPTILVPDPVLLTVDSGAITTTIQDDTEKFSQTWFIPVSAPVPTGALIHEITLSIDNQGFDTDTLIGIYSGTTLVQNLGIEHASSQPSGSQLITWQVDPPIIKPANFKIVWNSRCNFAVIPANPCDQFRWDASSIPDVRRHFGLAFPSLPNPLVDGGIRNTSTSLFHIITYSIPADTASATSQVDDTKDQAFQLTQNTALTVLGILPVILFFSLFAVFSSMRSS